MKLPPPYTSQIPDELRMQASDLLSHCIETGQVKPLYQVVENLLLVGPSAFYSLHTLLLEATQRRAQIEDEIHRTIGMFYNKIATLGLTREQFESPFITYEFLEFDYMMRRDFTYELELMAQNIPGEIIWKVSEYVGETREKLDQLAQHYQLCAYMAGYLDDWLWGMAYQTVQQLYAISFSKSNHIVL
ncbi:MAG: hypothetical protein OHK0052_12200 [Anaerolineales bacterium]